LNLFLPKLILFQCALSALLLAVTSEGMGSRRFNKEDINTTVAIVVKHIENSLAGEVEDFYEQVPVQNWEYYRTIRPFFIEFEATAADYRAMVRLLAEDATIEELSLIDHDGFRALVGALVLVIKTGDKKNADPLEKGSTPLLSAEGIAYIGRVLARLAQANEIHQLTKYPLNFIERVLDGLSERRKDWLKEKLPDLFSVGILCSLVFSPFL
jgi:hypothetical protein